MKSLQLWQPQIKHFYLSFLFICYSLAEPTWRSHPTPNQRYSATNKLFIIVSVVVAGMHDSWKMECKLKDKCPSKSDPLYNCWDNDCPGWMHCHCSALLLQRYNVDEADRPPVTEKNEVDELVVFCKKGCYSKWVATRKRLAKQAAKAAKPEPK